MPEARWIGSSFSSRSIIVAQTEVDPMDSWGQVTKRRIRGPFRRARKPLERARSLCR